MKTRHGLKWKMGVDFLECNIDKILKNNVLIITIPGGGRGAVAGGWEGRALSL